MGSNLKNNNILLQNIVKVKVVELLELALPNPISNCQRELEPSPVGPRFTRQEKAWKEYRFQPSTRITWLTAGFICFSWTKNTA